MEAGLTLRFWGVRGSTCASGPDFVEFGGHTPCVEVRCGERLFVIDAGTGINAFGAHHRDRVPQRVDLLLSHLHLDHVGGLPFMKPAILDPSREIHTWCGNLDGASPRAPRPALLAAALSHHPRHVPPPRFVHHGSGPREPDLPGRRGRRHHPAAASAGRHGLPLPARRPLGLLHQRPRAFPSPGPIRRSSTSCAARTSWSMTACSRRANTRPVRGWGTRPGRRASSCARPGMSKGSPSCTSTPAHTDSLLRDLEVQMQSEMPSLRGPRAPGDQPRGRSRGETRGAGGSPRSPDQRGA